MGENYTINQYSNAGPTIGHHRGDIIANQTVLAGASFKSETDKCRELMEWISPRDSSKVWGEIRSKVVQGTGQWFLESKQFTSWRDKKSRYLWVSGKAGAGKSFLSSTAIAEINGKAGRQVAYLYLSYKEDPSVQDLLGNLAGQLIGQLIDSLPLPPFIQSAWNDEMKKVKPFSAPPALPQVEELLSRLVTDTTFVVVDALDEFDASQRHILLNHLRGLPNVSLLVTSRYKALGEFETVDIAAHQKDIHVYIDDQMGVEGSPLKCLVDRDKKLREEIPREVLEKADGIFLLARLHINALSECVNSDEVRNTLRKLPRSRNSMYEATLDRIEKESMTKRQRAMTIIGWIVHAYRPLEVDELRHALLTGGTNDFLESGDPSFSYSSLISKDDILALCCGLVETDSDLSFRLIHYSTQEFFVSKKETLFPDFHARISLACAKYLCIPRLADCDDTPDSEDTTSHDEMFDPEGFYTSSRLEDLQYEGELQEYIRLEKYLNQEKDKGRHIAAG
ncbi:hypothetical protein BC567DRAFT_261580 [Phyllosticta citribraziliensis]